MIAGTDPINNWFYMAFCALIITGIAGYFVHKYTNEFWKRLLRRD